MTATIDLPQTTPPTTIKLLYSYGGKIVPRHPDGKLRYNGGHTRVLSVDRSISFSELLVKLMEMSGTSISLRCQLPNEDMDALVSITSDEDLANLIEEYENHHQAQATSSNSSVLVLKIRAFLSPPKSIKRVSPTPSLKLPPKVPMIRPCLHQQLGNSNSRSVCYGRTAGKLSRYAYHGPANAAHVYLIHHGNHWQ